MADRPDPYQVLGVARDADLETIRKAYKKLARKFHPDLNPGDAAAEERFKEISVAHDVLSDPERRRSYDEFGEIALDPGFDPEAAREARDAFQSRFGGAAGGFGAREGGPGAEGFRFEGLDDLLGRFFGGGGASTAEGLHLRGQDVEAELRLEFLDAVRGGEQRLTLTRPGPDGRPRPETFSVRIPPGASDGGRLRLRGKGTPGIGNGPPGDLWVVLRVGAHPVFRREGANLLLDLPVHLREAVLGAQVEVPTLDGRVTLTIPPGTHSGARLRLRGKGVPGRDGGAPGDLIVHVQIRVPRDLDDDARQAVEQLSRFEDPEIRKELEP